MSPTDYDDYRRKVIEAQQQWNRDREQVYDTQGLVTGFDGDFDPPEIPGVDNIDGMELPAMISVVEAMAPGEVQAAARVWMKITTELREATTDFNTEFKRTIEDGPDGKPAWGGLAADAAVESVQSYTQKTEPLISATHLVALKLFEMHTGLHQTQALMPGVSQRPDLTGKALPEQGVMKTGDYSDEEAKQEGQRILRTVYSQVAHQTDRGVPILPTPPQIVDQPVVEPPPGSTPNGPNGPTDGEPEPGGPGDSEPGPGEGEGEQPGDEPGQAPETEPSAASPDTVAPASAGSPSTTPASGLGTGPGGSTPGAAAPGTTGTGGGFGAGGGGTGVGSGGGPGGSVPGGGQGRSVPGGQQPAAASTTGAPAGRPGGAGAGRPMMGGMPMGGAGAGGQRKDDERSSGTPDYLVTKDHGDEATGLDSMEKTVPPVIGGDHRNG